ncbi:hypothetical protein BLS_000009 [Venturia inaequalis]|uniref:Uncharacterized protein n=1 Tax=Venturia inaequalis TaxID=5025 RepID=A0A8H3VE49_VENIN|nr:hypothetical protein BLS_000009 [Venturia inaequalis]
MQPSFNIKAIIATLACITSLANAAPASSPLAITLCNDINYGKCEVAQSYRSHCYVLDKATMAVSSIQFSNDFIAGCRLFESTTCDIDHGGNVWVLQSNPNLNDVNFNDVANSYFCNGFIKSPPFENTRSVTRPILSNIHGEICGAFSYWNGQEFIEIGFKTFYDRATLRSIRGQVLQLHLQKFIEPNLVTLLASSHLNHQLTPASSNMYTPSKLSVLLAALTVAFLLTQDVNAAPASNTLGVEMDKPAMHVDLCNGYYSEPLPHEVTSDLSRVGWAKKATSIYCKWNGAAYKAKKRNSLAIAAPIDVATSAVKVVKINETPAGDMVTVPYDASSDLSRTGWNKKANSLEDQGPSVPVGTLLPGHPPPHVLSARKAAPKTVAFADHRNRDSLMRITLYDKILFEDDGTPGSGYEFVMDPNLCIKLRDVNFERKTSSIKFERGPVCTFFETGDCNGGPTLSLPIQETNLVPFHSDDWKTWNDRICSFSCQWKSARKAREVASNGVSVSYTPAGK